MFLPDPGEPQGAETRYGLRPAFVIVRNAKPRIYGEGAGPASEVKMTPYLVYDTFEQITRIRFSVDQPSHVTVKLLAPGVPNPAAPAAVLVSNVGVLADTPLDLEWRGYDPIDMRKLLLGTTEGTFSIHIEAVSDVTGRSSTYLGALQVFH